MKTKYAFKDLKENMAKAMFKDLDISTKTSIEIANFIRGKNTADAKKILNNVLEKKQAIPFKRFTNGLGHKPGKGIAAGRFPQKASKYFIKLIELAEANAQAKGLSSNLKIIHLAAQKGSNQFHPGRQRRRTFKRTHIEIVVEEQEKLAKQKSLDQKIDKEPKLKSQSKKSSTQESQVTGSEKSDSQEDKK